MLALQKAMLRLATCLLEKGANVDGTDSNGQTILSFCLIRRYSHGLHLLLLYASEKGRVDIVVQITSTFMSIGSIVNKPDREGQTALMLASQGGFAETVQLLLESARTRNHLSNMLHQRDNEGKTALMIALQNGHEETVRLLSSEYTALKRTAQVHLDQRHHPRKRR